MSSIIMNALSPTIAVISIIISIVIAFVSFRRQQEYETRVYLTLITNSNVKPDKTAQAFYFSTEDQLIKKYRYTIENQTLHCFSTFALFHGYIIDDTPYFCDSCRAVDDFEPFTLTFSSDMPPYKSTLQIVMQSCLGLYYKYKVRYMIKKIDDNHYGIVFVNISLPKKISARKMKTYNDKIFHHQKMLIDKTLSKDDSTIDW